MKKANMNHLNPSAGKGTMTRTLIATVLTLAPLVVSAAGWTTGRAEVLSVLTNNVAGANYVWLETTANNVNNCTVYTDTQIGTTAAVFVFVAPQAMTDAQKPSMSALLLAHSAGKLAKIYSNGCNTWNTIDGV